MRLKDFQAAFIDGLLNRGVSPISVLEKDLSTPEMFYVYYNNLRGGLFNVLKDCYPCTYALLEDEVFSRLSHDYMHAFLPTSPYLCYYGDNFCDFIRPSVPPLVQQTAALERLLQDSLLSYPSEHASLNSLQNLDPSLMPQLTFSLCESMRFFESDYDLKRVWDERRISANLMLNNHRKYFYCIFSRHSFAFFHELSAAEFLFMQSLGQGQTLETAYTKAHACDDDFNLQGILEFLFHRQLVAKFL